MVSYTLKVIYNVVGSLFKKGGTKMKKLLAAALAITCAASLFAAKKQGKVLNIYCWNEEFQSRFNSYYASKLPSDVKVNWVITPNQGGAYQNKLDEALLAQKKAKADDKIDIFLVEADYALKYVDTDFTLDVIKDVGITKDQIKDQYKYTQDIMTDSKGNLKGLTWQACPGGFIYRRSIAKDVIGTDDPDEVGKALDNWDKFDKVAADAKAKGYFMLSGYDDAFRVFSDNMKTSWASSRTPDSVGCGSVCSCPSPPVLSVSRPSEPVARRGSQNRPYALVRPSP